MKVLRALALLVAVVGLGCGAIGLVALFTSTDINLLIALASFVPILLVATVVGVVASAVTRRWILSALGVGILAVAAGVYAPMYVAGASNSTDAGGPSIRVMQANLMVGAGDPVSVAGTVRDRSIDVLTVQELTDAAVIGLREQGMDQLLPFQYLVPYETGGGGAGVYSRFPISGERALTGYGPENLSVELDLGLRQPVSLLAVHPGPAYITPPTVWNAELEQLRTDLASVADRNNVIVSGDFNTTFSHSRFRSLLREGYVDSADRLGTGLVPTYPTDKGYPAIVGIDHILTRGADPTSLERIDIPGSDHHGLVADISLAN